MEIVFDKKTIIKIEIYEIMFYDISYLLNYDFKSIKFSTPWRRG